MASRIPRIACPDPAPPRSRREKVGSLARVYARFAPNLGRGPEARRVRQTSPPDAGQNPVAGRKWINSGRKRAVYNLGAPLCGISRQPVRHGELADLCVVSADGAAPGALARVLHRRIQQGSATLRVDPAPAEVLARA